MLMFNYSSSGIPRLSYQLGETYYDLKASLQTTDLLAGEVVTVLAEGSLSRIIEAGLLQHPQIAVAATRPGPLTLDPDAIVFRPPIDRPRTIIGIGRNYGAHADEGGLERQDKPRLFNKLASSVIAHGEPVARPIGVTKLDWEGELGIVIGRQTKAVRGEDALGHLAGYLPLNDLSAREFQFDVSPGQTSFAKSMDGFCPIGPTLLVAMPDIDPASFTVRTFVNGEKMQEGNTSDLIFDIPYLISYISQYVTLLPGDIVATGTPAGVGHFRDPPVHLQPGDTVTIEIPTIGRLQNTIVENR